MVGGPARVFLRHHEKDIARVRFYVYGEKSRLTEKNIIGYHDANTLYLYCSADLMPCAKDTLAVNEKSFDQKRIATKFPKNVSKEKAFGFAQVDIEVPDELYDKFSEMAPLLVVQEIPDYN